MFSFNMRYNFIPAFGQSYYMPMFFMPVMNFMPFNFFNFGFNMGFQNYQQPFFQAPVYNYYDSYRAPSFDSNNYFNFNTSSAPPVIRTEPRCPCEFNTELPKLNEVNYNAQKGEILANDVVKHVKARPTNFCAKYVKEAIARVGLGAAEDGDAYQYADVLSRNRNFTEVKAHGEDIKTLPAGCIVVYPRGDAGCDPNYGHIEVALGNGKAASDFINNNVAASDNARVFVPV